jgi:hypothetical protein
MHACNAHTGPGGGDDDDGARPAQHQHQHQHQLCESISRGDAEFTKRKSKKLAKRYSGEAAVDVDIVSAMHKAAREHDRTSEQNKRQSNSKITPMDS